MDTPREASSLNAGKHRREPSNEKPRVPSVLVFDRCCGPDHGALAMLEEQGWDVVPCRDSRALLEEVVRRGPSVVVFGICPDSAEDLGILQLVRRASADVPLILLATEGSLNAQRLVQSLRPLYYAVCPVEPAELREAVIAALARPRPGTERLRRLGS
jgi:DNA-binding NtrC family response regulator